MKDLFRSYHRQKMLSHIGVIALSIVFAISANIFLFSSNTGPMLKANILEAASKKQIESLDFIGTYSTGSINFQNNNIMQNVRKISFSLAYNPDEITIGEGKISEDFSLNTFENTKGLITFIINMSQDTVLAANTEVIRIDVEKIDNSAGLINVLNANFTDDSGNIFHLSTEGIIF